MGSSQVGTASSATVPQWGLRPPLSPIIPHCNGPADEEASSRRDTPLAWFTGTLIRGGNHLASRVSTDYGSQWMGTFSRLVPECKLTLMRRFLRANYTWLARQPWVIICQLLEEQQFSGYWTWSNHAQYFKSAFIGNWRFLFLKGNLTVSAQCRIIIGDFSLRAVLPAHSEAFMSSHCTCHHYHLWSLLWSPDDYCNNKQDEM